MNLPREVLSRIRNIKPPLDNDHEDLLAPRYLTPQGFSIALAYKHQFQRDAALDLGWVWHLKTSPKIQFFMWLVCLDRLPHGKLLFESKVSHQRECPRCLREVEDSHHILRSCQYTQDIWAQTPAYMPCPHESLVCWAQKNLKNSNMFRTTTWATVFPFLCFEIWKSRNHVVFNPSKPHLKPVEVLAQACRNAMHYTQANTTPDHSIEPKTTYRLCDHAPPTWTLLNVDAAFKNRKQISGLGGHER